LASPISDIVGHDAFLNKGNDLGRKDIRYSTAFLPEDFSDGRASRFTSISTHFESEMFVDVGRDKAVLLSRESSETP